MIVAILIGIAGVALFAVLAIVSQAEPFPYPDKCWDCRRGECGLDCLTWED